MNLEQNDLIYTPDEEAFNKAVKFFVEAGANHDEYWCSWCQGQHKYGIVWGTDNDLVDYMDADDAERVVSLSDLEGNSP